MRRKIVWINLICLFSVFLVGCWDYIEIERLDFVLGVGLDQIEPSFDLILEVMKTEGGPQQTKLEPIILTTKGETFFSSGRSLSNLSGKRLFWSHAKLFIVSEEVARQGILQALEFAIRDPDLRTSILLFVAKDCTVEEIYHSKAPFASSITEHIVGNVEFRPRIPVFFPQEAWQFRIALAESGLSGTLPTIQLVQEGTDQVAVLEGTALFKGEKMVGWLNGQETRLFGLLKNEQDRGPLVIHSSITGQRGDLTYEIQHNRVKIKPVIEGDQLTMILDLELQLDLSESGSIRVDFKDVQVIKSLEEEFNVAVAGEIHELLWKAQKEYNADVIGFGLLLKRTHPNVWRACSDGWDEIFRNLEVAVNVRGKIISTGVLSTAIHLRD